MLFFIIEILLPKHSFKNSDGKNILNQVTSSNLNSVFIPTSTGEFTSKKALNANSVEKVNRSNSLNSLNNLNTLNSINNMGSNMPTKTNLEGINENLLKSLLEKFINTGESTKRDKLDFLPMLTSSNENEINHLLNPSFKAIQPEPFEQNNINTNLTHLNSMNSLNNINSTALMRNLDLPKLDLESEQNSVLFRNPSPNPFLEELNFTPSNLFASPRNGDNFSWRSAEGPKNLENAENMQLCMDNNFNQTPLTVSRNNSMDFNDLLYKNNEGEMNHTLENNYVFDDSYFSVTSERYKSDTKSEKP